MMPITCFSKQSGYTFIEVLTGLAIFAIGYLAVAGMQVRAVNATSSARNITHALELAEAQAETFYSYPFYPNFANTALSSSNRFTTPSPLSAGIHEAVPGHFTIKSTIADDLPLSAVDNIYTPDKNPSKVTVSKTIFIAVYETRNPNRIIAELEMIKVWERDL
jgi:prepilin-type N-terminal cleavage/methylation domain-containing protein